MRSVHGDFPQLNTSPYVYFDSAATTYKPSCVIDAISEFYTRFNAPVHRAVYQPSIVATELYEKARQKVATFINAPSSEEVIFTRGATDSLNILADSFAHSMLTPQSRILVSEMEHHSNLIPWQMAASFSGASLEPIPMTDEGKLSIDALQALLARGNVCVVAVTHCSNTLGSLTPIQEISKIVHAHKAFLIVDGAQAVPHVSVDVRSLGCDAYAFSGHKMYGPTGIGVLWAKRALLESLSPVRGGGDMIDVVSFASSTWADLPQRFEPGTPPVAEAIGLGAAIDYLASLDGIAEYEQALYTRLYDVLKAIPDVQLVGTLQPRAPLQAFFVPGAHPLDIATLLDLSKIAVRSGHLCCQPLLKRLGVTSLVRASLSFYNSFDEIELFGDALNQAIRKLKR